MSASIPPPEPKSSEPIWAKPSISVFALAIFVVAFGIAYLSKDSSSLTLMMGAAISMANQVVNYYLGSSSGSARKTDQIVQQSTKP